MRCEVSTEQWTRDARETEHGAENSLVPAPLSRRHDVANHCLCADNEATTAQTLNRAEHDQLRHVLTKPAQRRTDQKEDDRRLQHDLSAVEITELAVNRRDDRLRQQITGDDPRQMLETAELADDCW